MHYLIYKTTNLLNGKFYVGKHQTTSLNDGYVGSGKLLRRAIRKYGIDSFVTKIVAAYKEEKWANLAELILVVVDPAISYNLCKGGHGGFSYINRHPSKSEWSRLGARILNASGKNGGKFGGAVAGTRRGCTIASSTQLSVWAKRSSGCLGKNLKDRGHAKGSRNSQFGSIWITDGLSNKKIKRLTVVPIGWRTGRVIKCPRS